MCDKKTTFLRGLQHRRQPCCASQQGGGETVQRHSLAGSQPIAGASPLLESVLNNRLPKRYPNRGMVYNYHAKEIDILINTKLVGPESNENFVVMKDFGEQLLGHK